MIYDREAITKEFAFGRCRRCEGPPDGFLHGDYVLYALCTQCRTAWWAIVSFDGWEKSGVEAREFVAELAGWNIGDEEEAFAGNGWDFAGERRDAYFKGAIGEGAISKWYGLPWRGADFSQIYRAPDGTPIHVRTARSEKVALALRPEDDDVGDINVLTHIVEFRKDVHAVCWWGGPPCPDCGRRLKSMEDFPLQWML